MPQETSVVSVGGPGDGYPPEMDEVGFVGWLWLAFALEPILMSGVGAAFLLVLFIGTRAAVSKRRRRSLPPRH